MPHHTMVGRSGAVSLVDEVVLYFFDENVTPLVFDSFDHSEMINSLTYMVNGLLL